MPKHISILGSTGSIGCNALKVIESLGSDYELLGISGHSNVELLEEQARKYKPRYVAITQEANYLDIKQRLDDTGVTVISGPESLVELATLDEVDTVITAVVGAAGLLAVLEAAKAGKTLAIANKEPLVIAGQLLMETSRKNNARVIPIDSEHSAIFQSMQSGSSDEINKLILTSSGGPFRKATIEEIENATIADALNHPTWNMGPKITVDSATMMNKALEVIEARWLFDVPVEKIDVLVHPESVVHSMVEFIDGSVIAQLGTPDMCLPIQYSLTYPRRVEGITSHLNLSDLGILDFEKPNFEIFRALEIGFEVAGQGASAPVVFNAANEIAVEMFLEGRIGFSNIVELIERALSKHKIADTLSLESLVELDSWAREYTKCCVA